MTGLFQACSPAIGSSKKSHPLRSRRGTPIRALAQLRSLDRRLTTCMRPVIYSVVSSAMPHGLCVTFRCPTWKSRFPHAGSPPSLLIPKSGGFRGRRSRSPGQGSWESWAIGGSHNMAWLAMAHSWPSRTERNPNAHRANIYTNRILQSICLLEGTIYTYVTNHSLPQTIRFLGWTYIPGTLSYASVMREIAYDRAQ